MTFTLKERFGSTPIHRNFVAQGSTDERFVIEAVKSCVPAFALIEPHGDRVPLRSIMCEAKGPKLYFVTVEYGERITEVSEADLIIKVSGKRGMGATFTAEHIGKWRSRMGDLVTYRGPTEHETAGVQRRIDAERGHPLIGMKVLIIDEGAIDDRDGS